MFSYIFININYNYYFMGGNSSKKRAKKTKPNNYWIIFVCLLFLVILIGFILVKKNSGFVTSEAISNELPDYNLPNLPVFSQDSNTIYRTSMPDSSLIPGETPEYEGYIIEFEDSPVIVEHTKLSQKAKENENKVQDNSEFVKSVKDLFLIMPDEVETKLEKYSSDIKNSNAQTKERILNELGKIEENKGITGNAIQEKIKPETEVNLVFNGILMNITDEEAQKIKNVRGVKNVHPNYIAHVTLMDSVPMIGADKVWQLDEDGNPCSTSGKECLTGKGVTIGIIDTGVDYTHPDLGGCFGEGCKVIGGYDFINNDGDPMDDQFHGTHVASIAAGNGILKGVAPDAEIIAYKVCHSEGCPEDKIINSIEMSMDLNNNGIPMENEEDYIDIISLSLGGPGDPSDPMSTAIDNVVNAGVVAVIAAGNSGPGSESIDSPGTSRKAITVGAVDKNNTLATFSSRGPVIWEEDGIEKIIIKPDIVAPGVDICAAKWDDGYVWGIECLDDKHVFLSGTSMSTPHVSGAVALLKQKHPDWSPDEIKESIKATADNIGPLYTSSQQGRGLINLNLLISLESPKNDSSWDFVLKESRIFLTEPKSFEIKGLFPEEYDSLEVVWRNLEIENSSWSNDKVEIIASDYVIAKINPMDKSGRYEFKISIEKNNEIKMDNLFLFYVLDNDYMEGWPIISEDSRCLILEDINKDSIDELIFSIYGDKMYVINNNGQNVPKWPISIKNVGIPSIADVDNDGGKDLVVLSKENQLLSYLYARSSATDYVFQRPFFPSLSTDPPLIADLNKDGKKEILITSGGSWFKDEENKFQRNRVVYLMNNEGRDVEGWPVFVEEPLYPNFFSPKTISDLDGDGTLEILFGTSNSDALLDNSTAHLKPTIEAYYYNGSKVPGFPKEVESEFFYMVSGDLNKDGFKEIIILEITEDPFKRDIAIFNYEKNSFNKKCEYRTGGLEISLGDLNQDSNVEIISTDGSIIEVIDYNCNLLPGWPKDISEYSINEYVGLKKSLIADIYGDSNQEIITLGARGEIFALDYNGELVPGFPKYFNEYGKDLVIGNFDSDPYYELVVSSEDPSGMGNSYLSAFNLDKKYEEIIEWPMDRHDSQHTGCYDCFEPTSPPTPITNWTQGIVSWWKLDGNAQDSVGNNNGHVEGASSVSSGCKSGGCYSFDGINDYINLGQPESLDFVGNQDAFTIAGWIKVEPGKPGYLLSKGDTVMQNRQYGMFVQTDSAFWGFAGGGSSINSGAIVGDGTWRHIAITVPGDGSSGTFYVDGVADNSPLPVGGVSNDYDILLGARRASGNTGVGFLLDGSLDEIMVWDRELSASEIQEVYDYDYY